MTLTTSQAASHHRRRRHRLIRIVAVLLSALALPVAVAAVSIPRAAGQVYPPRPATLPSVTRSHPHLDLARPTVAIVLGADGANAADTLAPFEVFARSGGFNVVLVGPTSLPVPLTGGLDMIPDFTFAELADRLPRAPEVVVVPQINGDARPAVEWVAAQHAAGTSVVMSVCVGA